MTVRKLKARQEKVRALLVDGQTIRQTADILKMTYHQVRHIADNLVYLGYLRRRTDIGAVVMFSDPHLPPTGGTPARNTTDRGSVFSRHTGVEDTEGRSYRESRVHLNGEILYKIRNIGRMETIRDRSGFALGDWGKVGRPKGRIDYKGYVTIDGIRVTFAYRKGNKGSNTLAVWPQDVWTSGPNAMAKGEEALKGRATRLTELLHGLGWRFFDQEVRGTFESGHVNDPRVSRMKRDQVDTGAQVKADTSPRIPEIEVNDDVANDLLAYTPEHIVTLYAQDDAIIKRMDRQDLYVMRMMALMDKVIAVQQQDTVAIGNLTVESVARRETGGMFA